MVSDYKCNNCGIEFSIGSYHYHGFETGYVGRNLNVCSKCGCQHAIEIAITASEERYNNVCEIVVNSYDNRGKKFLMLEIRKTKDCSLSEALSLVKSTPFTLYKELTEKGAKQKVNRLHDLGVYAESKVNERRNNPFFGLQTRDRFLYNPIDSKEDWKEIQLKNSTYDGQRVVVSSLSCGNCNSKSGLVSKWDPSNMECPRCSKPELVLHGEWLT